MTPPDTRPTLAELEEIEQHALAYRREPPPEVAAALAEIREAARARRLRRVAIGSAVVSAFLSGLFVGLMWSVA